MATNYNPSDELKRLILESEGKTSEATAVASEEVSVITGYRISNPSEVSEVLDTGFLKKCKTKVTWGDKDPETGKRKKVISLESLVDVDTEEKATLANSSPLMPYVNNGELRLARVLQVDENNKPWKGHKFEIYEKFARDLIPHGYIAVRPNTKDTELQIFYETPEKLAEFFGISVERLYGNIDKIHKWLALIKTPTKVSVSDQQPLNVFYHEEENNENNAVRYDGDIFVKQGLKVFKPSSDKTLWDGFCALAQARSRHQARIILKGLYRFGKNNGFNRKAAELEKKYGTSLAGVDMIVNQHALKFDAYGMKHGNTYTFPAADLIRIIGMRFKAGTSTLGGQLPAMKDMKVAKGIMHEHGIMQNALLLNALAKGLPYPNIMVAGGYEKLDTNKFLDLAYMLHDGTQYRLSKCKSDHNRHMSILEAEYRKGISSIKVNTLSAYVYTDDRCDEAMKRWHEKTGEWVSFAIMNQEMDTNDRGEITTIKYPMHSAPCVASHKVLRVDIFDDKSPIVIGIDGGIGLSTLYQRSVFGLDCDGDKLAVLVTQEYVTPYINLSKVVDESKGEKPVINNINDAVEYSILLSKNAFGNTLAIGYVDLIVRYILTWCHLNNVTLSDEFMFDIANLREGGIKGGIKTDLKGIGQDDIDVVASLEAGTLTKDILNWASKKLNVAIPAPLGFREFDENNLAEIVHNLVIRGGGAGTKSHSDIFLYRMLKLLPAYMKHQGNKSNNPWHEVFETLSEGVKPEYLEFTKNDGLTLQKQYTAVWNYIKSSFATYGEELGYSFDIEAIQNFSKWLSDWYRYNSRQILSDYRGYVDPVTYTTLKQGDWDNDRKKRRYQRLARATKFMLNGLKPHDVDLADIPNGEIPTPVLMRCLSFADKNKDTMGYLKFAHICIATTEFHNKGADGGSGGVARMFPAEVQIAAREMYYELTVQGKMEPKNPFLVPVSFKITSRNAKFLKSYGKEESVSKWTIEEIDGELYASKPSLVRELAIRYDEEWFVRAQKWLEKNPYQYDSSYEFEDNETDEEWIASQETVDEEE